MQGNVGDMTIGELFSSNIQNDVVMSLGSQNDKFVTAIEINWQV